MHKSSGLRLILIFLLLAGCAGIQRLETLRDARKHMLAAEKLEDSRQFHAAALEYAFVANAYAETGFYKTAVFKAALLSGHPDNPERNLETALVWLEQYRKLGLSEKERQSVQMITALLKEQQRSQAQIDRFKIEFRDLKAAHAEQLRTRDEKIQQLEKKIVSYEEQVKVQCERIRQLQGDISKAQDALQQLKDIDLQIHRSRTKEAR